MTRKDNNKFPPCLSRWRRKGGRFISP